MLYYEFDSSKIQAENQKMIKALVDLMEEYLKIDGVSIMLEDQNGEEIVIVVSAEKEKSEAERKVGIAVKIGERVAGRAFQNNEPILIVGDVSKDERFSGIKKYEEIYSGMSVPINKEERVIGVINAKRIHSEEPLTTDDMKFVEKVASVLGKNL